ncbi:MULTISPECIES: DUF2973 domain-containing protein [Prochlorococcus]|uniref:DUF2973 domain-containing protein n=1 Tax=Prochlorococcus TaxID=1218 RepID=UPI00053394B5|nr:MULTISPECIES: DUF2973 domain-containing protein [Prochlorococcus]MEC7381499.1 DUF2973 domain-containing protein [Cyanobacteriota bacterium]RPF98952.1 MAG: DUF2973 domain-containing protein [Prochlorococcus sp. TMED223]RZO52083.1 MAG: DUF2973 domain-containing protein [Prochlorococcus sp. MED-G132]HJN34210.1 DUF2973 domain-containing protein [Prochlorococcus sp.]KGG28479.1 hypothetical protein EV12_0748 [Prochlorococcus sp. MIT 0701]
MENSLFPILYGAAFLILLWQAFRVMGKGFGAAQQPIRSQPIRKNSQGDRTGLVTVHPELLDQEGRLTEEELLTVRFSGDNEPPQSTETPAE